MTTTGTVFGLVEGEQYRIHWTLGSPTEGVYVGTVDGLGFLAFRFGEGGDSEVKFVNPAVIAQLRAESDPSLYV